ncbi:response regulator transcription factor [Paenibacillus thermotolerans]|uniref:response regulator transcription factor n=1 Tax=Paenibacillus thermotolerans TaxID=3027807 RepID=UPI002368A472|nr:MULTISPECIES: response regulator transcription factor [unclassified Paenibacillus]
MSQNKNIRILLVDDEPHILQFLEMGLAEEGYEIRTAPDGMAALHTAAEFQPHIVVLDVMMPGIDGFETCRLLKKKGTEVAVIMLTARDEIDDRVKGLKLGADDYLVKPFSFEELLARIEARIRNQFPSLYGEVALGPFRLDDRRREICHRDRVLDLSPTEYDLLRYFIVNHDIVLSKAKILDAVWGYDFGGDENIVEVYVRSLRDKLGDKDHRLIRTIRGAGYRVDLS